MVVDSSLEPQHKNVMIASINGEQTVKQLWIDGENIQLIPKNSRHKPIEMQKGMDLPDTRSSDVGDSENYVGIFSCFYRLM